MEKKIINFSKQKGKHKKFFIFSCYKEKMTNNLDSVLRWFDYRERSVNLFEELKIVN